MKFRERVWQPRLTLGLGPSCGLKYLSHIVFLATWDLYLLPDHLLCATPCLSCFHLLYGVADVLWALGDIVSSHLLSLLDFSYGPRIFHLCNMFFLRPVLYSDTADSMVIQISGLSLFLNLYLLVYGESLISYLLFFYRFISLFYFSPAWLCISMSLCIDWFQEYIYFVCVCAYVI